MAGPILLSLRPFNSLSDNFPNVLFILYITNKAASSPKKVFLVLDLFRYNHIIRDLRNKMLMNDNSLCFVWISSQGGV